jgi:hypothetical protein
MGLQKDELIPRDRTLVKVDYQKALARLADDPTQPAGILQEYC